MTTSLRPSEAGGALLSALMVLLLLASMGTVAAHWTQTLHRDQLRHRGQVQARAAAEGGMARARLELARDPSWPGGEFAIGRCRVRVDVERDAVGRARPLVCADAFPGGELGPRVRVLLPAPSSGVRQARMRSRPPR